MKHLIYLYILFLPFVNSAVNAEENLVNIKCSDGLYSFEIRNFDGENGDIYTSGNRGNLTRASLIIEVDQPYKNFTVFTDEYGRKISIANTSIKRPKGEQIVVYFNDFKYTCELR